MKLKLVCLVSLQLALIFQMKYNQDVSQIEQQKGKCELVLGVFITEEEFDRTSFLIDDEEIEMRELQTRPDTHPCSDHPAFSGILGCSLCKG